jgi:hypothetical protein
MRSEDLVLSVKIDELSVYSRQAITSHFPRCERHALGQDIRACLGQLRRHYTAAFKRTKKQGALFELDVEIELLRSMVRQSHDLRYINTAKLEKWMRLVNEVGALTGSLIKRYS